MSTSITADQIRQDRALDKMLQCRHGRPEATLVATADQACIGHHLYGEDVPGVEYALRVHSQSRHGHAQQIRAGRDNLQWHVVNSLDHSQSLRSAKVGLSDGTSAATTKTSRDCWQPPTCRGCAGPRGEPAGFCDNLFRCFNRTQRTGSDVGLSHCLTATSSRPCALSNGTRPRSSREVWPGCGVA